MNTISRLLRTIITIVTTHAVGGSSYGANGLQVAKQALFSFSYLCEITNYCVRIGISLQL